MSTDRDLKPIEWKPLTGLLDDRSEPNLMPSYSFRRLLNVGVTEEGKLVRKAQWQKLLSKTTYNNEDLHDQLLALQTYQTENDDGSCGAETFIRDTERQPVTLVFQAQSSTGHRKLVAGTESRLYAFTETTGNWKVIGDGYGRGTDDGTMPKHRFHAAQCLDMVMFTNDFDVPFGWLYEAQTLGCAQRATTEISDFEVIGLTKAKYVWVWKDVTFLADVEMDGVRRRNRIIWSDYQNPESWDPSKQDTIAGYRDLDSGEIILGGMEVGNIFLIYTDRRIWQMDAVGGDQVFAITRRYTPASKDSREACLAYPNTLVSIGSSHVYMGTDGVYEYDLYSPEPRRVDWIHRGTKQLFSDIAEGACDDVVGHYDDQSKEIWFSWPTVSQAATRIPNKTLVINKQWKHVATVDHGFTAFCNYQSDPTDTVRDYIIENCICTPSNMTGEYGFVKEGLPLTDDEPAGCVATTCIYSSTVKRVFERALTESEEHEYTVHGTLPAGVDYVATEDWLAVLTSTGSLCEKIGDVFIEDNCSVCNSVPIMVMADGVDFCLKERAEVYSRERCTNPTSEGTTGNTGYTSSVGTYALDGFDTYITAAPMDFSQPRAEKQVGRFDVEAIPIAQLVPSTLNLRVGTSEQIVDPVTESCTIMWKTETGKSFECKSVSAAAHAAAGTRPATGFAWPVFAIGKYFYWELSITGTGGGGSFSAVVPYVKLRP